MNIEFFKLNRLKKELRSLSHIHQIAFATACCERMVVHYDIFVREYLEEYEDGWEGMDSTLMRVALDEMWRVITSQVIKENQIRKLLLKLEQVALPYEDHTSYNYDAEAQRSVEAVCKTLELCLNPKNIKLAVGVARQAHETFFEHFQFKFEEKEETWEQKSSEEQEQIIANHRLTIREMTKETEDLKRLQENPVLTGDFLQWLRESSYNNGKSLLDLSLLDLN